MIWKGLVGNADFIQYGRQLTALVLGNLTGLDGEPVMVGDHRGLLISEECGDGGT